MSNHHAYYLARLFDAKKRQASLKEAKSTLKKVDVKYDGFLVVNSVSGMFGTILAHAMKKKLVVARKEGVISHSGRFVENVEPGDKLIFVDDCIASGDTLSKAVERLPHGTLVGAYLYGFGPEAGEFRTRLQLSQWI